MKVALLVFAILSSQLLLCTVGTGASAPRKDSSSSSSSKTHAKKGRNEGSAGGVPPQTTLEELHSGPPSDPPPGIIIGGNGQPHGGDGGDVLNLNEIQQQLMQQLAAAAKQQQQSDGNVESQRRMHELAQLLEKLEGRDQKQPQVQHQQAVPGKNAGWSNIGSPDPTAKPKFCPADPVFLQHATINRVPHHSSLHTRARIGALERYSDVLQLNGENIAVALEHVDEAVVLLYRPWDVQAETWMRHLNNSRHPWSPYNFPESFAQGTLAAAGRGAKNATVVGQNLVPLSHCIQVGEMAEGEPHQQLLRCSGETAVTSSIFPTLTSPLGGEFVNTWAMNGNHEPVGRDSPKAEKQGGRVPFRKFAVDITQSGEQLLPFIDTLATPSIVTVRNSRHSFKRAAHFTDLNEFLFRRSPRALDVRSLYQLHSILNAREEVVVVHFLKREDAHSDTNSDPRGPCKTSSGGDQCSKSKPNSEKKKLLDDMWDTNFKFLRYIFTSTAFRERISLPLVVVDEERNIKGGEGASFSNIPWMREEFNVTVGDVSSVDPIDPAAKDSETPPSYDYRSKSVPIRITLFRKFYQGNEHEAGLYQFQAYPPSLFFHPPNEKTQAQFRQQQHQRSHRQQTPNERLSMPPHVSDEALRSWMSEFGDPFSEWLQDSQKPFVTHVTSTNFKTVWRTLLDDASETGGTSTAGSSSSTPGRGEAATAPIVVGKHSVVLLLDHYRTGGGGAIEEEGQCRAALRHASYVHRQHNVELNEYASTSIQPHLHFWSLDTVSFDSFAKELVSQLIALDPDLRATGEKLLNEIFHAAAPSSECLYLLVEATDVDGPISDPSQLFGRLDASVSQSISLSIRLSPYRTLTSSMRAETNALPTTLEAFSTMLERERHTILCTYPPRGIRQKQTASRNDASSVMFTSLDNCGCQGYHPPTHPRMAALTAVGVESHDDGRWQYSPPQQFLGDHLNDPRDRIAKPTAWRNLVYHLPTRCVSETTRQLRNLQSDVPVSAGDTAEVLLLVSQSACGLCHRLSTIVLPVVHTILHNIESGIAVQEATLGSSQPTPSSTPSLLQVPLPIHLSRLIVATPTLMWINASHVILYEGADLTVEGILAFIASYTLESRTFTSKEEVSSLEKMHDVNDRITSDTLMASATERELHHLSAKKLRAKKKFRSMVHIDERHPVDADDDDPPEAPSASFSSAASQRRQQLLRSLRTSERDNEEVQAFADAKTTTTDTPSPQESTEGRTFKVRFSVTPDAGNSQSSSGEDESLPPLVDIGEVGIDAEHFPEVQKILSGNDDTQKFPATATTVEKEDPKMGKGHPQDDHGAHIPDPAVDFSETPSSEEAEDVREGMGDDSTLDDADDVS